MIVTVEGWFIAVTVRERGKCKRTSDFYILPDVTDTFDWREDD